MHRRLLATLLLAATLATPAARAQTAADSAGIRAAALDYVEGWYEASPERMSRALHPELAKRIVHTDSLGRSWVSEMGATQLVRNVWSGGGSRTPPARRRTDVRILDVFQNTASVRVDADAWVDYLHVVKFQGRWVILNVLWELRH